MVMVRIDDAQVRDAVTGELIQSLVGQQVRIVARDTTTPFPIFDSIGDPITGSLVTVTPVFTVPRIFIDVVAPEDVYLDWLDEGTGARGKVDFDRALRDAAKTAAAEAAAAREAAEDAAAAAGSDVLPTGGNTGQVLAKRSGSDRDVEWVSQSGGSGGASTWDQIAGKPPTYPAEAHQHTASQISDASGLGRQLFAAGDPQSARALIGAGTGNGTSNLTLGTTASTAAPGNHVHSAASVSFTPPSGSGLTATNVQDALTQAAQSGGSAGTSQVLVWRYASGAYPTLPTTKPSGVVEVRALGPVQPATVPSWAGLGASQVVLTYEWVPLT